MGTLLHFYILAMPRFLVIPWVLGGGIRKSVLHVCNLSATTVITAFTASFLPPIPGSLSVIWIYICPDSFEAWQDPPMLAPQISAQGKSKSQGLCVFPVSSEPCWGAWTPLRQAIAPELPNLSHDSHTRSITGTKTIAQLCLCITWAALQD